MLWLGRDADFYAALKTYFPSKLTNPSAGSEETAGGMPEYTCTYQKLAANDYELVIMFFPNAISGGEDLTIPAGTIMVNFYPASGG